MLFPIVGNWKSGEEKEVEDEVAEKLLTFPNIEEVGFRKQRRRVDSKKEGKQKDEFLKFVEKEVKDNE